MKVLHIGNLKSGIDTYVRNTVAMASDELEFVIVNGADDNSDPYIRKGVQVKAYSICMYRALNPFRDMKAVAQAMRIIRKEKPDMVHCHSAKGGVIGRIAAFLTGTKVAYTAHAFSFLSAESGKKKQIFLLLEKIARLNSRLIACSESERLLGIGTVGFKENRAFVWSNSIPDPLKGSVKVTEEAANGRFICSIGRPSYQKNPLFMVEVAKRVHEKFPDIKFYLLGVGFYSPMLDEMKALIKSYGLDDVFILKPWLSHEETMGYVKNSLLYLMTSLYEGLPISVIEALAFGKAVVASDVIGNRDCVRDGVDGYLVPLDVDKFVGRIKSIIVDENLRLDMEKNARECFEKDFLIDNRIDSLEGIYSNIINQN